MILQHPTPFEARWRCRWIWYERPRLHAETVTRPVQSDPADRIGLFRRVIDIDAVPDEAPARVWVDGRYVLSVNGRVVARGPVRSDARQAHYDIVDLAPHLVVGTNVVAIIARHFGVSTSWWAPVPPTYSLGAGCLVFEARIGDEWVCSDASWRAQAGDAWTPVPLQGDVACLPLESFDARRHPQDWDRDGFDDAEWAAATEILPFHTGAHGDMHSPSEPFGMLRPPVRTEFPDGATHVATRREPLAIAASTPPATATTPAPAPPTSPREPSELVSEDPVRQLLRDEAAIGAGGDPGGSILCFDLGHIAAGTVEMSVRGAVAGTVIDVAGAEHLDDLGRLVTLGQHAGFRYVCRGGGDTGDGGEEFETLDLIGARHLHASVRVPVGEAERMLLPQISLAVHDRHRPRPAGASFECSDPRLNHIYEVGLRTVDLCALDAYVDCPTREQRAWTGDSVVHQQVDLVTNPDWSMARWHPQLAAAAPRGDGMLAMAVAGDFAADDRTFIPDWSLHWVRSVHNLYRYTGDVALVAELAPVVERTLRWFEAYLSSDGLLHDVSGWCLIDWASVYSSGCSSALNALWARGLEDFAEMSEWLGNAGTAAWARSRWEGVRNALDAFWDDDRGLYVDHVVGGVAQGVASQHGGAAALAAGLVPTDRLDRVVDVLVDRDRLIRHSWVMDSATVEGDNRGFVHLVTGYPEPTWDVEHQMVEAEPFYRYVVHDGIARAGRADLVADRCRDWQVFVDVGETTWPECWVGGTHCHGWSSTPTRDLIVHTLGITPAEPGYAAVRIAPALGDLDWARATVPTPQGFVTVEARSDGTLTIDSPVPVISP